jgi:hypothetical protein
MKMGRTDVGRRVGQRQGEYDGDVTVLLRMVKAVEQDNSVTEGWRTRARLKLREAIQTLLTPERVGKVTGG